MSMTVFLRSLLRALATAVPLCVALSGCLVLDDVSPRTYEYNLGAADTKSEMILTNIVRAAYAEPLQFTELGTISGQGGFSAGLSGSIPFPFRGGKTMPLAQQFINANPQVGASANNQFAVTNLNTQEFYQGIQTPVSRQIMASYFLSGFDGTLLLQLLVSEIEVVNDGQRYIFVNNPLDPKQAATFNTAIRKLLDAGLSAEPVTDTIPIGPVMTPEDAKAPSLLTALANSTSSENPTLKPVPEGGFQLTKSATRYRFCFDRAKSIDATKFGLGQILTVPESGSLRPVYLATYKYQPLAGSMVPTSAGTLCGANEQARRAVKDPLKIRTRSVEGVFYFLGQSIRPQLGIPGQAVAPLRIQRPPGEPPLDLFKVYTSPPPGPSVSVRYRGDYYGIAIDPTGELDLSSRALQLITGLIALQSSAKNLPAPALVTLIGP